MQPFDGHPWDQKELYNSEADLSKNPSKIRQNQRSEHLQYGVRPVCNCSEEKCMLDETQQCESPCKEGQAVGFKIMRPTKGFLDNKPESCTLPTETLCRDVLLTLFRTYWD